MLITRDIPDVEILSVGSWHGTGCPPAGCSFTTADLDEIAATYAATSDLLKPPMKLGHDDEQKLLQSDGYPAAGWLANVRRVGDKLLADMKAVPKAIAELIDVGAYRTRSVELEANLDIGGKTYPMALTGLALLGADLPAVENLGDITALYQSRRLTLNSNAQAVLFTAPRTERFALPAGMSYEDLTSRLRSAFVTASPGADADSVWVSDLYEASAIFCLEGRYWQQAYTVNRGGDVMLSGMPSEVQRVTEWQAVTASRGHETYVDNAEHVLADVRALTTRTAELASLRAKDGRRLSDGHRERLTSLRDGLREVQTGLEAFVAEAPTAQPDYTQVMRARARMAQLRSTELLGVST